MNSYEELFKQTLLDSCAALLYEAGYASGNRGRLYKVMCKHVINKIFSGKNLSEAKRDDIEFAMDVMPEIKNNFSKAMIAGIVEGI